jgi:hypothetical protein
MNINNCDNKYRINIDIIVPSGSANALRPVVNKYLSALNRMSTIKDLYETYEEVSCEERLLQFEVHDGLHLHYVLVSCIMHKMRNIFYIMVYDEKRRFLDVYNKILLKKPNFTVVDKRLLYFMETNIEIYMLDDFKDYSYYMFELSNCLLNLTHHSADIFVLDDFITLQNQLILQFESILRTHKRDDIIDYYLYKSYTLNHYCDYFYMYIVYLYIVEQVILVSDATFLSLYEKYMSIFEPIYYENMERLGKCCKNCEIGLFGGAPHLDSCHPFPNHLFFANLKTMLVIRYMMCTKKKRKLYKLFKTLFIIYDLKVKKYNKPIYIYNKLIFREYMRLSVSDCQILLKFIIHKMSM